MADTFGIHTERQAYSDEEILSVLRRYAAKAGGGAFTSEEFDAWEGRPFASRTAIKRFGSWRLALAAIGVPVTFGRRFGAAELMEDLERVWKELGRAPTGPELAKLGRYPVSAYIYRWRSLRWLCRRVSMHHKGTLTRERLLAWRFPAKEWSLSTRLRLEVLRRDKFRCTMCGRSPASDRAVALQVDHITPLLQGGKSAASNLRTLCRECNHGRREYGKDRRGKRGKKRGTSSAMHSGRRCVA